MNAKCKKPIYAMALQAKDTGRFLFARKIGTKNWYFVSTVIGGGIPITVIKDIVFQTTGRALSGIMSFANLKKSHISIFHHWLDEEGEVTPSEDQELMWAGLFDLPSPLDKSVLHAFDDPIFLLHIIKPEDDYAV